ncbi:MAG: AsmA family protein [Pseudomonadota bacterium]
MKKILKYLLWTVLGVVVLAVAVVAYVAATFDPNDYKPQIIKLVKEQKRRDLQLGDIQLTFFPSIGAEVSQLVLSERDSSKEFAAAQHARVELQLLPLFSKQAVVDAVELDGVRVALVRRKDGSTNIDDLLGKGGQAVAQEGGGKVGFDIGHVAISDLSFTYRDEQSGAKYELAHASLKTGRIASGVPGEMELSLAVQGNQPKLALDIQVGGRYTFDLDGQRYGLRDLKLEVKGEAAGITDLVLDASGNLDFNGQSSEFSAAGMNVAFSGKRGGDNLLAKLDAPKLSFAHGQFGGDKATLNLELDGGGRAVAANLVLTDVAGSMQAFRTALVLKLSATLPDAPTVSGDMRGSLAVDRAKESVQASFAGTLMESQVRAKVGMNGFTQPVYNFDLDIDKLDVDRLLPPKKAATQAKAGPEQPLDLSALKGLNANGNLRIAALMAANIQASQVKVGIKAANGMLVLSPLSATLYQGTLNGSATVSAAGPRIALKQDLAGVSIAPLLKDVAGKDVLEGKGRIALDVTTQGATVTQMKKALNGSLSVNLADGAIKGINLAATLRSAKANLGGKGEQTQAANTAEKTDFSELKASFAIRNGVAHNEDLSLKSPLLRVGGNGDINVGEDSINYLAKATVVATAAGQGGAELAQLKGMTIPVRVMGPYTALQYKIDFGAMVGEVAKQKVEEKKEELKSRLQEELKSGLKGLFR